MYHYTAAIAPKDFATQLKLLSSHCTHLEDLIHSILRCPHQDLATLHRAAIEQLHRTAYDLLQNTTITAEPLLISLIHFISDSSSQFNYDHFPLSLIFDRIAAQLQSTLLQYFLLLHANAQKHSTPTIFPRRLAIPCSPLAHHSDASLIYGSCHHRMSQIAPLQLLLRSKLRTRRMWQPTLPTIHRITILISSKP